MNCANHPDRERSAFCQNCGKPLCAECIRTIGNSIFCEPCYHVRAAGAATTPGPLYTPQSVPRPGIAAVLGLIPGVGAMYNAQYAKGIVHLVIFVLLVSLADRTDVFGLFVAGWVFYMAFEAYHTARARRDGMPLPNPFGFNEIGDRLGFGRAWQAGAPPAVPYSDATAPAASAGFSPSAAAGSEVPPAAGAYAPPPWGQAYAPPATSWGAPQEGWGTGYGAPPAPAAPMPDPNRPLPRRIPTGAIWLIGLGVLFLFGNMGIFWLRGRFLGPLILIGFGVWTFVHRMTASGLGFQNDGTSDHTWRLARCARGSIWMVVVGFVWLLDVFGILYWHQSWPIFLIVAGLLLFLRHSVAPGGYPPAGYGYPPYPGAPAAPVAPSQSPVESTTAIVPVTDSRSTEEGR
ncbi:MAG: hypothetical protein NVSMB62_00050 [Acidobacteriaceae bacterium]